MAGIRSFAIRLCHAPTFLAGIFLVLTLCRSWPGEPHQSGSRSPNPSSQAREASPFERLNIARYNTTVAPNRDEDIAQPCDYELVIPNRSQPIRAVFVVYERGSDMMRIY